MRFSLLLWLLPWGAALAVPAAAQTPIWMLAQSLRARTLALPASRNLVPPLLPSVADASPGARCRAAIARAEQIYHLPAHLLGAIGRVESGRRDAASGAVDPWPWSINVEGIDHVYETEPEAIAAVRSYQASGSRSIDVGCLQVNLMFHPDAFATLEAAFDPERNADYAARFLVQLQAQTGDWQTATAWYHSATPALGDAYRRRVMASLPEEAERAAASPVALPASAGTAGAFMLGNRAQVARLILAPAGVGGRGLAGYRAAPVLVASRAALR